MLVADAAQRIAERDLFPVYRKALGRSADWKNLDDWEQTYLIQCVMAVSDAVDAIHETETDYDQSPDYEIRLLKALHRNSILQAATVGDPEEAKRHLRVAREAHNGLLALKGETSTPNSLWL